MPLHIYLPHISPQGLEKVEIALAWDEGVKLNPRLKAARRALEIEGESSFLVLGNAKMLETQGRRIIHLEIGEPDFTTPANIREAAIRALKEGETHYTPTPGMLELRRAIAEKTAQDFGVEVCFENVSVTLGSKEAIFAALASIVEEGDEVIYPNPGYQAYASGVMFFGGKPVPVRLREEDEFRMTPDEVNRLVSDRTKAIIINSPQNPTGAVLSRDDVKGIVEIAKDAGAYVISDEIYRYIIYDGLKHYSPLQFDENLENTIVVDGFSKYYAMTGWRLGYVITPEHLTAPLQLVLNLVTACPSSFIQIGGLEALRNGSNAVREMVEQYAIRRGVVIEEVSKMSGVHMVRPRGAFYGFLNVKEIIGRAGINSLKLASILLEKYGVAVLHGSAMGSFGEGYVRISYANSVENIRNGLRIMSKAFNEIAGF
ncbi:MAG: pyridoxal phosphate-dependent aminotransferase [Candidatus Brockarchaeota archaeon]|nr:pyridoxal phosphate-dependent aminotransferase [Candidatus Brockarchaeota archaeon]